MARHDLRGPRAIWLVRHGESTWNALGLAQGHTDHATLTPRGRRQAREIADRLRGRGIAAIYSSDLRRARQTADILATSMGLRVLDDPDLRERCLGTAEGSPVRSLRTEVTGIDGNRVVDSHARPIGGESLDDLYRRAAAFVGRVAEHHHGRDGVVAVAHGGTVRVLRAYCAGRPVQGMAWDVAPNCGLWQCGLWREQAPRRAVTTEPIPVRAP